MDESKQPGIGIQSINLFGCHARLLDPDAKLEYSMGLTQLTRTEEGNALVVLAMFDLMHGILKPPCELNCTFVAVYTRADNSNMTWIEFSDVMAVTHMIPYVREFVSSVTLRMPIHALILPPTNVNALLAEYKGRQKTQVPTTGAIPTTPQKH